MYCWDGQKQCLWEKTGGGWWVCVCVALVSFSSPSTAHTEATESRSLLNSTAPKQRLTHRQWRVFSTDNCCGLSSELACRLGPDTYSPHYTHKHRHAFRSEQTKKKTAHTCRHVQKPALVQLFTQAHTHKHKHSSSKLLCRTDSDYRITLQRQLEYAFKLCIVSTGFCSPCEEEPQSLSDIKDGEHQK